MERWRGFSLLEVVITLVVVSLAGLSVQTQVWRHWRWLSHQQMQTIAVMQMRNVLQQWLVTPAASRMELLQRWQREHTQALPGSRSHWQWPSSSSSHEWTLTLGWPAASHSQPLPQCEQAGVAMPQCLIFADAE